MFAPIILSCAGVAKLVNVIETGLLALFALVARGAGLKKLLKMCLEY